MLYANLLLQAALPVIVSTCATAGSSGDVGLSVLVAINECTMEAGFAIRQWTKALLRLCTGCMYGMSFALSMSSH